MKNDPQNTILHLLLTDRKKWRNYGSFSKKKSENYTYGGMVRESPPCDFQIFFDAKLLKTIHRIRFSIYFWPPEKIFTI